MLTHSFYKVFVMQWLNEEGRYLVDMFMHSQTLNTRHLVAMTCDDDVLSTSIISAMQ